MSVEDELAAVGINKPLKELMECTHGIVSLRTAQGVSMGAEAVDLINRKGYDWRQETTESKAQYSDGQAAYLDLMARLQELTRTR